MGLKNKLRDYLLQKSRNISYRPADYKGYEKMKSIAIVFESGKQDKLIFDFAKKMEEEGKQVQLLGFVNLKRKEIQAPPTFNHFTKDEVNWIGKPKSEEIGSFLNGTYEVFITLNERAESPIQFITVAAKSDFIIGLRNDTVARLDLQVGTGSNHDYKEVFKEAEYYLKFINKQNGQG